jgi:putative transposase
MARAPRDRAPGIHHVVVGAAGPIDYFRDAIDRMDWIRRLVRTLERHEWTCVLMSQMTTHLHLLVDVPDESLPIGMHSLNSHYGTEFNARHGRIGHLIRSRYWSKRMKSTEQLLEAFRYGARNPLEAGLCARPEDWRWSSFGTSCRLSDAFPFVDASVVLSQFAASETAAINALRAFVGRG